MRWKFFIFTLRIDIQEVDNNFEINARHVLMRPRENVVMIMKKIDTVSV